MRSLLQQCGFMREGDNLHRLVAAHRIELPEMAQRFVEDHEVVERDPFDALRVRHEHNVFAIDSITTSEVDDAIGIRIDEEGNEVITVYVADATVHCPIFSQLEQFSARMLTTTTYLPEGVFFMLPHRITQAATLRPDRPCRTFNINFRIDPESGELFGYSVDVGLVTALRRITYDQTQDLLEAAAASVAPAGAAGAEGEAAAVPPPPTVLSSSPEWLNVDDVKVLRRIHDLATLRYKARERRARGFTGSMPDPLIIVDKETKDVVDVRDQIICTKDARLAVAEMMIAANEVCSRVAQASKVVLPFRGSRPLSSVHEAAADGELVPPSLGYATLPSRAWTMSENKQVSFFARTLVADMEKLRGVTRAYYSHTPVYHNGLDTHHYCHSTSPLRRYPDMLVHHQLKALIARSGGGSSSHPLGGEAASSYDFIPEADMIKLCNSCSTIQQKGKIMQMRSDRFWVLRFLEKKMMANKEKNINTPTLLRCFVGATEYIAGNPEAHRVQSTKFKFRSDVFIPEVQLVHSIYHNRDDMLVGVTATARLVAVEPYTDKLLLEVQDVSFEEDLQRQLAKMVMLIADA